MIDFPNAKINLGLNIVNKRTDGFHELETIFYPVTLIDSLEILEAPETHFFSYGMEIPGNTADNLCMKAYELMSAKFNLPPVHIHLLKNIPFGAGLGGGSADAAFTLTILHKMFKLGLPENELMDMAAVLGSDCAFFIRNTPQYATGRGEKMEPVLLDLSSYKIILVNPGIHISTAKAFGVIQTKASGQDLREIIKADPKEWRQWLKNDFEEGLFPLYPELAKIKNELYRSGAIYASLSGSGSTMFGIFPSDANLNLSAFHSYQVFKV